MGVAGFVDIHCHILPGMDDGPAGDEQAQAIAGAARIGGTAAIIATPHFSERYRLDSEDRDKRLAGVEQLADAPPLVFPGCELELSEERLRRFFEAPRLYTLNGSRYALVELPYRAGGGSLERAARLFREQGLCPILAHPERYLFLAPESPVLSAWIACGGLLQATASSFTGRMGRRARAAALVLLSRRMLHFVASDAHDAIKRGPDMREAFASVAEASDILTAGRLFTHNPLAVVRDEPLLLG